MQPAILLDQGCANDGAERRALLLQLLRALDDETEEIEGERRFLRSATRHAEQHARAMEIRFWERWRRRTEGDPCG